MFQRFLKRCSVFSLAFNHIRVSIIDNEMKQNQSTCKRLHLAILILKTV